MSRTLAITALFAILLAFAALLTTLAKPDSAYTTVTADIMASPITVLAPTDHAAEAADIVFDVFRDIDRVMSEWKPTSPLSAVNAAAGVRPVAVPDDLRLVVRRGHEIGVRTNGAFDITWASLWGLWDFTADAPRVPGDDEIDARVAVVDHSAVVIDDQAGTVYLPRSGMAIGLGGIAKGHALDVAASALRDAGIESFLISAAGQMMVGGLRGDRTWRVGIRDPRGPPDDHFAFLELTDTSISTSGDYERFFIADGVRYHHILDPRTGRPTRGLRSVSVVCTDATLADALSTALMCLGVERGTAVVEAWDGVEALFVDDEGGVHMTSGLEGWVQIEHAPARQ